MANCSLGFKKCKIVLEDGQKLGFFIQLNSNPNYRISRIESNSQALKANLKENDVLVEINETNIRLKNYYDVCELMADSLKNKEINLTVIELSIYNSQTNIDLVADSLVTTNNTTTFTNKTIKIVQKCTVQNNQEHLVTLNNRIRQLSITWHETQNNSNQVICQITLFKI